MVPSARRPLSSIVALLILGKTNAFVSTQPTTMRVTTSLSVLSSSPSFDENDKTLPTVEFVDPETRCQVVLLGCFHGTVSSAQDVEKVVTPDTDVVVLELCTSRFADLQREVPESSITKPWIVAYLEMIGKTIQKRGFPTGLAAAVLGGVSGMQTALSGFTPGLEFSTALERATEYECDVVLADQAVDETLRKVGSLPKISWEILRSGNPLEEWQLHSKTLQRAVMGQGDGPQVQLGQVLIRNNAAVQDLVRLTIPPTLLFYAFLQAMIAYNLVLDPALENLSLLETMSHYLASLGIFTVGYLGFALPAIRVILTERDDILIEGMRKACQRAGPGGRVVAVLGLLHVNGVAKSMMEAESETETEQ